jgi:hypothetical protein
MSVTSDIPTTISFVHRRERIDATAMAALVTRGSEPTAGETERSGEGVPPDYDNTIRQRGSGDECNTRFVARNL